MKRAYFTLLTGAIGTLGLFATGARADSIDPSSYSAGLFVGDSVTIEKTVVIEEGTPADAPVDIMFVFDVTGSMGSAISAAKTAADSVLSGLDAALGDLRSGSGWYSDVPPPPGFEGVFTDLNSGNTGAASGISAMATPSICNVGGVFVGCGGDLPELGYDGIADAARNASWSPGSNRFILALGDASFKTGVDDQASTIAALDANNVTLLGVSYGGGFTTAMSPMTAATGGSVVAGGSADALVGIILGLVTGSFQEYDEVTLSDTLGLPGVGTSVVCTSADVGACVGDTAVGDYDRSVARVFTFNVTFTGLNLGTWAFDTHALVDGGIVATEEDLIRVLIRPTVVPSPATIALMGIGLIGIARLRRRK